MAAFEHLKLLRRLLVGKRSGTIEFHTNRGTAQLHVRDGGFLSRASDNGAIRVVQAMLTAQIHDSYIRDLNPEKNDVVRISPEEVILRACYEGRIEETRIWELFKYFSLFPPVTIKLAPLHQSGPLFPGFSLYLNLHAESVQKGSVSLKEFLIRTRTPKAIREHVQLLAVLYVLGLIEPASASRREGSIFSRLIRRIRDI